MIDRRFEHPDRLNIENDICSSQQANENCIFFDSRRCSGLQTVKFLRHVIETGPYVNVLFVLHLVVCLFLGCFFFFTSNRVGDEFIAFFFPPLDVVTITKNVTTNLHLQTRQKHKTNFVLHKI